MSTKNELLVRYLKEWLHWAENYSNGITSPYKFNPWGALCNNVFVFILHDRNVTHENPYKTSNSLRVCLRKAFERRGLNPDYPFGKRNYHRRFVEDTQHLCPKRIAFVKDVIAKGL